MSSNLIFKVPGRTTNYMPVNINASKNEILEKYARRSFSTVNDWPEDSPAAGYYDIRNSDTKLILLNNQKTFSHLRGKTTEKHESSKKDANYDWVEKEIEMKKISEMESNKTEGLSSASRVRPDPDRHLLKTGCSYKYVEDKNQLKSDSFLALRKRNKSTSRSNKSINKSLDKKEEEGLENEILLKYLYAVGKRTTGLQTSADYKRPPSQFLSSYNINHPEFSKGQRLFLNELCSMYSVEPLKQSKKQQYIKLFKQQTDSDQKHRVKYRMHDGDNFDLYRKWLSSDQRPLPQQVNCGYYRPISSSKGFKSRSMIHQPNSTSSLSQASSLASSSVLRMKPKTAPAQPNISRPMTAKKSSKEATKVSSSSDTSLVSKDRPSSDRRLESKDRIEKIKTIDDPKPATSESTDDLTN